jgi:SpoVK/Ycf46/Vps4 family AAA+-type ATPase
MNAMAVQSNNVDEAQVRIKLCREKYSSSLDLSYLGLKYIPDEINNVKHIEFLNLSENALTELPDFMESFACLKYLDISFNKIEALPEAISNLPSLQKLNVRCNALSVIPDSIEKLAMLTYLDISHNRLSALPETIDKLSSLEYCNIRGNDIQNLSEKMNNLIKPKQVTIFGHMEKVIELTGSNGLSESFFNAAKINIEHITDKLGITPVQAVLFSHIIAKYDDNWVSMEDISRSIKCNKIKLLQYADDFTELKNKKLVQVSKNNNGRYGHDSRNFLFRIPQAVTASLMANKKYEPADSSNLSIEELFSAIESLFEQRVRHQEISYDDLVSELFTLMDENNHLDFVKKIKGYDLSDDAKIILIRFCHYYVNADADEMDFESISQLYEHNSEFTYHKRLLKSGDHPLLSSGHIENINQGGFGDRESFKLTDKAKQELLADLKIKPSYSKKDLIQAKSIQEKKLFYNKREAEQVEQFTSLMGEDTFKSIQARLSENNMRTGFACIFSGPPGTGKTETVYQIARKSGRDIVMVDISETKSMWFGMSEKIIKEIFTHYKNLVDEAEITPILFINEADAVISKRMDISSSAVAQTENAIQNIILQELENLKGILIATTNLTENMDKAFERRFLYKIEFKKPDLNVRQSIWQFMIPSLSGDDAKALSSRFDFSGGQIENIARKRTVDYVLSGIEPSLERLVAFCEEELLNKETAKRIGFGT